MLQLAWYACECASCTAYAAWRICQATYGVEHHGHIRRHVKLAVLVDPQKSRVWFRTTAIALLLSSLQASFWPVLAGKVLLSGWPSWTCTPEEHLPSWHWNTVLYASFIHICVVLNNSICVGKYFLCRKVLFNAGKYLAAYKCSCYQLHKLNTMQLCLQMRLVTAKMLLSATHA